MARARTRIAATALAGSVLLAGVAGVRAARLEPLAGGAAGAEADGFSDPAVHQRAATDPGVLELAAEQNPFHPERRPGGTFRMPGEADPGVPSGGDDPVWEEPVHLVGTVVGGGADDFVVCAVGPEPARIVRLGGACGDLVLRVVERGRAEFTDAAGQRVVLEVPKLESW